MREGIQNSRVVLAMLTRSYFKSKWCCQELRYADSKNKEKGKKTQREKETENGKKRNESKEKKENKGEEWERKEKTGNERKGKAHKVGHV